MALRARPNLILSDGAGIGLPLRGRFCQTGPRRIMIVQWPGATSMRLRRRGLRSTPWQAATGGFARPSVAGCQRGSGQPAQERLRVCVCSHLGGCRASAAVTGPSSQIREDPQKAESTVLLV
jgi:hypothetical protein